MDRAARAVRAAGCAPRWCELARLTCDSARSTLAFAQLLLPRAHRAGLHARALDRRDHERRGEAVRPSPPSPAAAASGPARAVGAIAPNIRRPGRVCKRGSLLVPRAAREPVAVSSAPKPPFAVASHCQLHRANLAVRGPTVYTFQEPQRNAVAASERFGGWVCGCGSGGRACLPAAGNRPRWAGAESPVVRGRRASRRLRVPRGPACSCHVAAPRQVR